MSDNAFRAQRLAPHRAPAIRRREDRARCATACCGSSTNSNSSRSRDRAAAVACHGQGRRTRARPHVPADGQAAVELGPVRGGARRPSAAATTCSPGSTARSRRAIAASCRERTGRARAHPRRPGRRPDPQPAGAARHVVAVRDQGRHRHQLLSPRQRRHRHRLRRRARDQVQPGGRQGLRSATEIARVTGKTRAAATTCPCAGT